MSPRSRSRSRRWTVVAVSAIAIAIASVGVVAARWPRHTGPRTRVVNGQRVFVIDLPGCPSNAQCALGVRFGGRFYGLSRVAVKPEFTSGRLLAVSGGESLVSEARAIDGQESAHAQVVAMRTPDGWRLASWAEPPFDNDLMQRSCLLVAESPATCH